MSFTDYYYNFGFNSTIEKVAAKKKDEGMSTGAKLGLGAAGLGAAGLGAYYGGDIMDALGNAAEGAVSHAPMADAGSLGNQALGAIGGGLKDAGQFANENLRDPMQDAAAAIKNYAHNAPGMLERGKESAGDLYDQAKDSASGMYDDAKGGIDSAIDKVKNEYHQLTAGDSDATMGAIREMDDTGTAGASVSQTPEFLKHLANKQQGLAENPWGGAINAEPSAMTGVAGAHEALNNAPTPVMDAVRSKIEEMGKNWNAHSSKGY